MRARLAFPVVVAAILTACAAAPPPPPVSVDANQKDLNAMAGDWVGDYFSGDSGRTGSIRFNLNPEQGALSGTVLMFPQGRSTAMEPANRRSADAPRGGQPLSVRFVVIEDGVVSGTLEPYKDPDCDCFVSTTFTGRVHGDVIQGTFVSHGGPGGSTREGRWKVTRKAGS
ncbi:MAG TPA: hypothetical protein VH394_17625 [Thermoanaerobaculia bacterium]|nr:hypothetical protein [Thermoanaerobaculia bacterium]